MTLADVTPVVLGVVQARMGSNRLPGKSLTEIAGKPCLGYLLESLPRAFGRERLHVVTSVNAEDDPIANYCHGLGIGVLRGDAEDVASRYRTLIAEKPCEYFFRFCGDSPLYDYRIALRGLSLLKGTTARPDILTSMIGQGYPMGMNLEVVRSSTFADAYDRFSRKDHFEHVTKYLYEHYAEYDTVMVHCGRDGYRYDQYKFSIDTPEDLARITAIAARFDKPHWQYAFADLCRLHDLVTGERHDGAVRV